MVDKISTKEANRNRIVAEVKRLTGLGLTASEIALQLKVKRNLILRIKNMQEGENA